MSSAVPSGRRMTPSFERNTRLTVGVVLSVFVFYPSLLGDVIPLRVVALVLGACAAASELWLTAGTLRRRLLLILSTMTGAVALVAAIELIARHTSDRTFAVNAEHFFVLFPLYGLFAALSYRHRGCRIHATAYVGVAAVTAVLAIIESILSISLMGRGEQFATSQREGITRALVGAEHVLVLGALLAVAVALAATIKHGKLRLAITVLLIAGCWATGSRAAAVFCVCVTLIQAKPAVARWLQKFWYVLAAIAGGAFVTLAVLSTFVWTPFIPGATGVEYSANYRFASYAVLVDVLLEHPFGYFFGTVPSGTWMMGSELRGPVDLARSADSELVFAVFAAGWIGVIAFLLTFLLGILALRKASVLGFATLLLTTLGFIMSLHGWDAASMVWYTLLGASAAAVIPHRRRQTKSPCITSESSTDGASTV